MKSLLVEMPELADKIEKVSSKMIMICVVILKQSFIQNYEDR